MKPKHILSIALCWACLLPMQAQTTREEMEANPAQTGGVYLAYPTDIPAQTSAPKGYKPFYISHYGRHGSRYLIGDRDYKWVLDLFAAAHRSAALTPLGEDVYGRLQQVWAEAEGHGGDLSPLGVRQHRGIAERMFRSFPEVFEGTPVISARSTVVLRCAMSMAAFGDRLKELNPGLRISYEASQKYMDYLNYHSEESNRFTSLTDGPCAEEYRKFKEELISAGRGFSPAYAKDEKIAAVAGQAIDAGRLDVLVTAIGVIRDGDRRTKLLKLLAPKAMERCEDLPWAVFAVRNLTHEYGTAMDLTRTLNARYEECKRTMPEGWPMTLIPTAPVGQDTKYSQGGDTQTDAKAQTKGAADTAQTGK